MKTTIALLLFASLDTLAVKINQIEIHSDGIRITTLTQVSNPGNCSHSMSAWIPKSGPPEASSQELAVLIMAKALDSEIESTTNATSCNTWGNITEPIWNDLWTTN